MPDTPEIPDSHTPADQVEVAAAIPVGTAAAAPEQDVVMGVDGIHESNPKETPVIDVHAPHGGVHTWKDFWIHLGTIAAGLLIALSLEQSVEALHHLRLERQLQADLRDEANANRKLILDDLNLAHEQAWFGAALTKVAQATPRGGKVVIVLLPTPCAPDSIRTSWTTRYVSPSEAVWTTAIDSGQAALLPAPEGRIYARMSHINDLLFTSRNNYMAACDKVWAMEQRFALRGPDGMTWTMDPEQAEKLAEAAADAQSGFSGLIYRLRYTLIYDEGLLDGSDINQLLAKLGELNENTPLPEERQ